MPGYGCEILRHAQNDRTILLTRARYVILNAVKDLVICFGSAYAGSWV